jgi:hypothetical protein
MCVFRSVQCTVITRSASTYSIALIPLTVAISPSLPSRLLRAAIGAAGKDEENKSARRTGPASPRIFVHNHPRLQHIVFARTQAICLLIAPLPFSPRAPPKTSTSGHYYYCLLFLSFCDQFTQACRLCTVSRDSLRCSQCNLTSLGNTSLDTTPPRSHVPVDTRAATASSPAAASASRHSVRDTATT